MKPTLLYIATLVVMACAVFTSCEQMGNQINKRNYNPAPMHVDFLKIEYSMEGSRELMDYVDIEITYANGKGKLVTDTITIDSIKGSYTSIQDFDGKWSDDSTHFYWAEYINIDTIPARLYLKYRYLIKPDIEVDQDKMIDVSSSLSFMDFPDTTDSYLIGDVSPRIYCPIYTVKGSKLKTFLELINENPVTLDYTVRPTASNPEIGEFVKND